jgi:phage shock protein A
MDNSVIKSGKVDLWKQPGGGLAKVGLWVMGAGLVAGLGFLLPFFISLAQNLIHLSLLLGGLGAILWILFTPQTRNLFKIGYLQVCRLITGFFVEIDPIAILENSIKEMKEKLSKVEELIVDIQATFEKMKEKLSEYEADYDRNIKIVSATKKELKKDNDQDRVMALQSKLAISNNKVNLLDGQIKSQRNRINTTQKNIKILKKLYSAAKTQVGLGESTLEIKKDEYEQAKKMRSVIRSIRSIFDGSWLTKSTEDQMALDAISNTINGNIAEFNMLLDGSNEILIDYDINTIISADKVDEILNGLDETYKLEHKTANDEIAEYSVVDEPEKEKVKVRASYF